MFTRVDESLAGVGDAPEGRSTLRTPLDPTQTRVVEVRPTEMHRRDAERALELDRPVAGRETRSPRRRVETRRREKVHSTNVPNRRRRPHARERVGGERTGRGHRQGRTAHRTGQGDLTLVGRLVGTAVRRPSSRPTRSAGSARRAGLIDLPVTVVVDGVARNFRRSRMNRGLEVVAVVAIVVEGRVLDLALGHLVTGEDRRPTVISVPVLVAILQPFDGRGIRGERTLVDLPVAVVVEIVAPFLRSRVAGGGRRGAVARDAREAGPDRTGLDRTRGDSVRVAVHVRVEGRGADRPVLVDDRVAVIVDTVAPLARARADRRVRVVAVGRHRVVAGGRRARLRRRCASREEVAVGVEVEGHLDPLVDSADAVVVDPVADLGRVRVDEPGEVIAVVRVRHESARARAGSLRLGHAPEGVAVPIDVERGHVDRVLVDRTTAVVVDTVAPLGSTGLHGGVAVVAVSRAGGVARRDRARERRRRGHPVGVAVRVAVERRSAGRPGLVDLRVAVVVVAVAGLNAVRVDRDLGVVAVVVVRRVAGRRATRLHGVTSAEGVGVGVLVVRVRCALIGGTIAVVILPVAHLRGAGEDGAVPIVAVLAVRDESDRGRTGTDRRTEVSEEIPIGVGVERDHVDRVLVDLRVAVIAHPVAPLLGARVDRDVAVVAVAGAGDVPDRRRAGDLRAIRITVRVGVRVEVPGRSTGRAGLVDLRVTVVVDRVADLARTRTNRDIPVVAVASEGDVARRDRARTPGSGLRLQPVPVAVRVAVVGDLDILVDLPVTVLIRAIADLRPSGPDVTTRVVAVRVRRRESRADRTGPNRLRRSEPVSVRVDEERRAVDGVVVDEPVAVVVERVADLARAGIDRRDTVVAVERRAHRDPTGRRRRAELMRADGVSPPVPIGIGEVGRRPFGVIFVRDPVAVIVVRRRAELFGVRVDRGEAVVAVATLGRVAGRGGAGEHRRLGIPEGIPVRIGVERPTSGCSGLVVRAVAVVVDRVTDLGDARVDRGDAVAGLVAQLIAVLDVAGLRTARAFDDRRVHRVPIAVRVDEELAHLVGAHSFVDLPVAVVVESVAPLELSGVDPGEPTLDTVEGTSPDIRHHVGAIAVAIDVSPGGRARARGSVAPAEAVAVRVREPLPFAGGAITPVDLKTA